MIDDQRAAQWAEAAGRALMRHDGKDEAAGHLAAIVLALLHDREDRERCLSSISSASNPAGEQ